MIVKRVRDPWNVSGRSLTVKSLVRWSGAVESRKESMITSQVARVDSLEWMVGICGRFAGGA